MPFFTRHLCQLFGVSPQTVRAWTEEFAEYLSDAAKTERGKHRLFTDEDTRVLAFVSQMRRDNEASFASIHDGLKAGKRGELPLMLSSDKEFTRLSETDSALAVQVEQLQQIVVSLQAERDALLPSRDEVIRLTERLQGREELNAQLEKRIGEIGADLRAAQDEIKKLNREIGKLEAHMDDD